MRPKSKLVPNNVVQIIVCWEDIEEGLQWNNFWTPCTIDDNLSVGLICVALLVAALLYILLAVYLEQVFPGKFGIPRPWFFPFRRQYWCGARPSAAVRAHAADAEAGDSAESVGDSNASGVDSVIDSSGFEAETRKRSAGVRVLGLSKRFGSDYVAVQPIHLNMYDNQITVLLGHDGAGKSTTMAMLTGMLAPTSGTALIAGHDVRTELPAVRSSLGLCMEHDILFNELTVEEHIQFYSTLKVYRMQWRSQNFSL